MNLAPDDLQVLLEGYTQAIVVVGSRGEARTVTASAVPVDILSTSDLTRQGAFNLQEQLRTVVPSFNVNTQPISDASTVVRPAMLRNLAPDHTLVLVNGKRRHRSAIIDWHGGNGVPSAPRGQTFQRFRPSRCGRSKYCATAQRRNTARTRLPVS